MNTQVKLYPGLLTDTHNLYKYMYLTLEDYNIYSIINCYLKKRGGGNNSTGNYKTMLCMCTISTILKPL